ncbi:MAG: hypothetical protein IPF41_05170 [Flavobacteriales bacterium]|nr:hypothetical protein [Flavobacteriales bacterium]
MEEGLKAMGFPELHIFQPSILTGPRSEKQLGERIGIAVMSAIAALLPDKYKPMPTMCWRRPRSTASAPPGGTQCIPASIRGLAGA